jgi:hypothetical protein
VYVPAAGFVSVSWFGPLPELPASAPSGANTLMSQSPTGISSIRTWNEYDGGWIVSRKLSQCDWVREID